MKKDNYYHKLGKKLISSSQIQKKARQIAQKIEKKYPTGVIFLCNLKGSFRFLSDLISYLKIPTIIDFIAFSRYTSTKSPGPIKVIKDLIIDIKNKPVIIVEDIIDTGITIDFIIKYLTNLKSPASIEVCSLLDKTARRVIEVPVNYRGFKIKDSFVVGYGLDFGEYFRELNDIYILNNYE